MSDIKLGEDNNQQFVIPMWEKRMGIFLCMTNSLYTSESTTTL